MTLTHLNARGEAHMVDVADKPETRREARATGRLFMHANTLALLADGALPKGDVLATARIAGIQAAKRTHELIPLCHALALSKVVVDFRLDREACCVHVEATCRLNGRTGVEMEALTAVSVACLTLYDMCKAVDKSMIIDAIQLEEKHGGRSGDWVRDAAGTITDTLEVSAHDAPYARADVGMPAVSQTRNEAVDAAAISVRFLAELRERLGLEAISIVASQLTSMNVAGLKAALIEQDPRFRLLLEPRVLVARNQSMASDPVSLEAGDEIAFFPPVTGG